MSTSPLEFQRRFSRAMENDSLPAWEKHVAYEKVMTDVRTRLTSLDEERDRLRRNIVKTLALEPERSVVESVRRHTHMESESRRLGEILGWMEIIDKALLSDLNREMWERESRRTIPHQW